jgi:hypothetical protein
MRKSEEIALKRAVDVLSDRLLSELSERNSEAYQQQVASTITELEKLSKFLSYNS